MKWKLCDENPEAQAWLPSQQPDGSGIGANYVDAYIKPMNAALEDGTKVTCKRRGLKISVAVGDRQGEALLRRREYGPDVTRILQAALEQAFVQAGVVYSTEGGAVYIEM